MRKLFDKNIKEETVSIHDVRAAESQFVYLKNLTERQIFDKIRNMWRYRCKGDYFYLLFIPI